MKYQFSTSINCSGCVKAVSAFINEVPGIDKWEVDTDNPKKVLTVEGNVPANSIIEAVKTAGFSIDLIKEQS
ncbi:MAG: cation transporter [Chitinophagales bacterium]|nr:cation transporter [Bacteroidota bacterium]MBP9797495.1 cation transporter [Chitinophagales bacterium]